VCCCHRNNRRDTHTSSYHKLLLELDGLSLVICSMERAERDSITARESNCSQMHSKVSCQVTSKPRDRFSRYSKEYTYTSTPPLGLHVLLQGDLYLYLIYIYLTQMLLSSGTVSTSKFFSKCPAFKFLPRGHCSSWGCRFSLLLGVNVETLVWFEIVMWPIPSTTFPVHPLYRSLGVPQRRSIK